MKVIYSDAVVADAQSFSPSARKPREVVNSWLRRFPVIEIVGPEAVSVEQICLAHAPHYVRGIFSFKRANGFGNHLPEVAASLPWTSGAMLKAARVALIEGCAVAPVAGFHHACHEQGGGYCTFNGLMITALVLHGEGAVKRVGILDFDQHYGNGTSDIIRELGLDWVEHYSSGAWWDRVDQAESFLEKIPEIMQRFEAALADHAPGRFGNSGENAADFAGFVEDGAVGEGEVRLLLEAGPVHEEQQVLGPGGPLGAQDFVVEGADDGPDFAPALRTALAQRPRVLIAEDRAVAVVVELDGVRAPPEEHGKGRAQADIECGAQALGPALDGAKGCRRPIHRLHERAEFTAAGEQPLSRLSRCLQPFPPSP